MQDIWSLRILIAVADSGSFSSAADQLVLTQPAVSRQIAALERRFAVALFRRHTRGVSLTQAGKTAVSLARVLVAQADTFDATMRSLAGLTGGRVRLAGFASVNTHFVPELIRRFGETHGDISVTLHAVDPMDPLTAVREGRVDVALVTGWQLTLDPDAARFEVLPPSIPNEVVDGVDLSHLVDEELRIALPKGHRLTRRRVVDLAQLRDERWVDGAYPDCLGPLPQLTAALGRTPDIAYLCDDWNGKQALVAGGAGIMVVPTLAASSVRADLVLRPTKPSLPVRRLYAATAAAPFRSPAASAIVAMLTELATSGRGRRTPH